MFGYIITNAETLPKPRQERFRAMYCGLCRRLRQTYGLVGSMTLSYDMTFLALLLNALYEPGERTGQERCPTHPMKRHDYIDSPVLDYVADINLALAYYKLEDNWLDDKSLPSALEARLLKSAYAEVKARWPDKCAAIEGWLADIHAMESQALMQVDAPVNATGIMLGELFAYKERDVWTDLLREIGNGLGRFIYYMDAYDDLAEDVRKGRYNPLKSVSEQPDYEALCRAALTDMVADATRAYEMLPIVQDADILSNVLYSGVWSRYAYLQKRRAPREKGDK